MRNGVSDLSLGSWLVDNPLVARGYRPVVRDQEFLLAPNMADWLAGDHLVWFVLDVVEQLDTSALHVDRRTGGVGRAGYDPDMLLALLIYAYATGQRSSRRIERLCADHVAYRVLCAQDAPDHTTIARFRAAHDEVFVGVFAQVLRLCAQAGIVQVGVIAIDGTKVAANASRSANRSQQWVREQADRIAEATVAEAAAVDAAEDAAEEAAGAEARPPAELGTRAGGRPRSRRRWPRSRVKTLLVLPRTPPIRPPKSGTCSGSRPVKPCWVHRRRGWIQSACGRPGSPGSSNVWPR